MSMKPVNPKTLPEPRGFNHGMLGAAGGRVLCVAGQPALDSLGRVASTKFVPQFTQALRNVVRVVEAAGGGPEDVGRLTIYVTDMAEYLTSRNALGAAYQEVFGKYYPAMSLVQVTALVDDGAQVEIEAMAVIPVDGTQE